MERNWNWNQNWDWTKVRKAWTPWTPWTVWTVIVAAFDLGMLWLIVWGLARYLDGAGVQ